MKAGFNIINIDDRLVCIGGVGTIFHESGFPLGMSALELSKRGIELSWFHVIKELYFQYTSNDRLFNKIVAEIEDAKIDNIQVNVNEIKRFIYGDWETQREMMFQYLWGPETNAKKHLKQFLL